jgi:hypothetical protein
VSSQRDLLARIAAGPRFLLLGQGTERTPLANGIQRREWFFPAEFTPEQPTSAFPAGDAAQLAAYDQSVGPCSVPAQLTQVAPIAWNGVLTSRIDSATVRWFEAEWRRVVPLATQAGPYSRSTTELQVRYLYGGLGLPQDERPPASDLEWIDSQRNASDALSELARNLITPKGVLLVEDWSLADWLSPLDLYNFASRLAPGQVHVFSASEEIAHHQLIAAAVSRGAIAVHSESLSAFLEQAIGQGLLPEHSSTNAERAKLIPTHTGFLELKVDLWNRILGTARPVDLELLEPFPFAKGPLAYQRFRSFLGASEGAPPWRAIASGLKLPRTYEQKLLARVESALDDPSGRGPVILQGQTASGKSLALVWLAQAIARSGRAAVLHQSRRRDRPIATDIEAFSLWVEGESSLPTVLIWDGMADPDEYFALDRQLRARGQRVLIVGSTYPNESSNGYHLTAPIHLDADEAAAVSPWLAEHGIELPPTGAGADTSFLALLYRALPETESGLRRGLALELRAAESGMEALSRESRQQEPDTRITAIARALAAAGFDIDSLAPSDHTIEELAGLGFAERSTTEQLSAMLLCAGRRNLNLPLELALRVVGREGSTVITDFVKRFDIFRWTEDADGGQYLGVRTRLEAELLAREELTDLTEVEVATSFIKHARADPFTRTGGDEVQFIVDLMEQIGPQSEASRFSPWYGELAAAFQEHREAGAYTHPRVALLEANLTREFVKRSQRNGELSAEERIVRLRTSEDLLTRTLEDLDTTSRTRLNLYVELAASVGSQLYELVNSSSAPDREVVQSLTQRLVDAVMHARETDPENIYPVDVLAWSAKDLVTAGSLDKYQKLALLVDAQASLDSLDPQELSPKQQAKCRSRQAEIAQLLGDSELEASYLRELLAMDDPAAYYLLATRALGTENRPAGLGVALQTLLQAPKSIREDWKCARLMLDLFWESKTGARLMRGERNTVPFTEADWQECLDLLGTLHGAAGFDQYKISFLRGLALFHLGSISSAQDEYRRLGSLGLDVSRRVHLAYLASNPNGTAREFTGRVASATPDGRRGRAWVDQLKAEVDFVPLRFSPVDFRSRNETLPTFHIGFNYRGPIADPIRPGQNLGSVQRR